MTPLRILLCDDEPLALARLNQLLSRCDDVDIVGRATDGATALDLIGNHAVDVLLLDVEMPLLDGFDVVEELGRRAGQRAAPPVVVFVTAHAGTAAAAFETGATDFLTKPVRLGRLELALGRVRRALEDRLARQQLDELLNQVARLREVRSEEEERRIWVRRRGEAVSVLLNRLDRISAEREYIRLHQGDRTYLHRSSLTAVLPLLDERRFLRVHRSHVVARCCVAAVQRTATGDHRAVMLDGAQVPVGRSYRSALRSLLDQENGR